MSLFLGTGTHVEDKRTLLTFYSVTVVYAQPNEIAYIPTILQFMFVMSQNIDNY